MTDQPQPFRRKGLLRRSAPFTAIMLLAFAAIPISSSNLNQPAVLAAAVLTIVIVAAAVFVPWHRLPRSAEAGPPIAYFIVVALLVQSQGDETSGYAPLVMLPVFWLALYGTRSELAVAFLAAGSMFIAPLALIGDRAFPQSDLREALLWVAVAAVVGFTAQQLVQTVRRAAAEAARREQALRESEERLNTVLETMADALVVVGADGEVVLSNRAAETVLGTMAGSRNGSGWSAAQSFFKADGVTPLEEQELPLVRAVGGDLVRDAELFIRSPGAADGAWISASAAPLKGEDGRVTGGVAVFRDITERRQAEQEAERLKDEFFALVSHELRTPLTSIVGYLDLLDSDDAGKLTAEGHQFLEVVQRNANRLLRLVGDLLLVAQVQAGKFELKPEEVDLNALASQCVEAAAPAAREKTIDLSLEADSVPRLLGDRDRLAQLLDNLISNALKFTPEGERIDVRLSSKEGHVLAEVHNSGTYIAPRDQERLFERFSRASSAGERTVPGVGLGLAICKAITEAHGGEISVESAEGVGTTFRLVLPIRRPPQREDSRREHDRAKAGP